jgi:predicted alpha/beta-fold hydrolase
LNERPRAHGRLVEPADYRPVIWLPDGHTQTLWAARCRRVPRPVPRFERVELPDGDFIDLAHVGTPGELTVLILHGLEGDWRSPYASALLAAIEARGWHGVVMHFRGCSGEPNRLARSYHSGDTDDLAFVAGLLTRRSPVLCAVGYSLGGNVLLKYLGENGEAGSFAAAAAVSVPFDLAVAADTLNRGFARLYQHLLVRSLQARTRARFARVPTPIDLRELARWTDFRTFDDRVTAPLHGFDSAEDYYRRSSCRPWLSRIATPTLVIHALDDPFLDAHGIPTARELAAPVRLELVRRGGHVGFVTSSPWLEPRLLDFLGAATASG